MPHAVTVKHNFETGHRLPHLPGKCQSLHGHSWWAEVTAEAPALTDGLVVEFGPFKQQLRRWIDEHLDHGLMLGPDDPLLPVLAPYGMKIHQVPDWPTVENVAALIAQVAGDSLQDLVHAAGARVTHVKISETYVNAATWTATL
ncbi:6-pyruvoyl tetrahydropterin synthase family protein [Streptomyces sp. NPDC057250]|uniref:6-pyruvoyl trahydropterin synthase family protein n=1 Tax=Streptomyces sp. NPDC057250 TaxID=3346068 RepID=UPI00362FBE71